MYVIFLISLINSFSLFTGEKFEWKLLRWMRYEKCKPNILQYKISFQSEENFKEINISPRRQIKICYTAPLKIASNKKRDLLDMLPFINPEFHNFYHQIHCEGEHQIEIDSDLNNADPDD